MQKRFLRPFLVVLFFSVLPSAAHACAEPSYYPDVTWTTHIQSITPQSGIAGVTEVYVQGYCFGDSAGSITIGGVPVTNIKVWTDFAIEFVVPSDANTGDLVVASQSYGSDDSAGESVCCGDGCTGGENWPFGTQWCGNDTISADFTVTSPQNPGFVNIYGSPSPPRYVDGSWFLGNGGETHFFTLTQGTQDPTSGMWTVTGTEWNEVDGGPNPIRSGLMDRYGDVVIEDESGQSCIEFQILNSGDVTTPAVVGGTGITGCATPEQNFLFAYAEGDEGPYWDFIQPPLFKSQTGEPPFVSQTDLPALETPAPQGWAQLGTSTLKTYGIWERSDVGAPEDLTGMFESRFVYEQSGGSPTDGCYFAGSKYEPAPTTVSGGAWFVDSSDQWGPDYIGDSSQVDSYYQNYYGPKGESCEITGPQAMYIDARTNPATAPFEPYATNTLMPVEITPKQLLTGVQPEGGSMVTECENYPSLKGKCH